MLNLSFSAPPRSYYWDDPLNQAVMAAWKAGIVVVASAGNTGPEPMTIGVPGNVPYVITVGAMSDNWTPNNPNDDVLASFSATGPTHDGFVKPEIVAPGGHIIAVMDDGNHLIAEQHPQWVLDDDRLYHDVRHLAVDGGGLRRGGAAAPGQTVPHPGPGQVSADRLGPPGGQGQRPTRLQPVCSRARA